MKTYKSTVRDSTIMVGYILCMLGVIDNAMFRDMDEEAFIDRCLPLWRED